jgi:hypothetical protein
MPARFELCQCGRHGRIIFADDCRGGEFVFKEHGFAFVRSAVEFKRLDDGEMRKITEEILASSLPQSAKGLDKHLLFAADTLNCLLNEHEGAQSWPPEVVHILMTDRLFEDNELPEDINEAVEAMLKKNRPQ